MNTGLLYFSKPVVLSDDAEADPQRPIRKQTVRERVIQALEHQDDVPALPATVHRLVNLLKKPHVNLDAIAEVARLDPGITAQILRVASSPSFGGQTIYQLRDALLMIGLDEMKRIASTISVINTFRHLRVKVNWDLFWLHSLLTARLTERLVNAYGAVDGGEYLAGLLHDVGKLFLEHNFLREFELVLVRAVTQRKGMYAAENELFDITHAEVSAMLCNQWHLPDEVVRAVRLHHEPSFSLSRGPSGSASTPLVILCVRIANQMANRCHANIPGAENLDDTALETAPEWRQLQQQNASRTVSLDVAKELQKAQEIIHAIKTSPGDPPATLARENRRR